MGRALCRPREEEKPTNLLPTNLLLVLHPITPPRLPPRPQPYLPELCTLLLCLLEGATAQHAGREGGEEEGEGDDAAGRREVRTRCLRLLAGGPRGRGLLSQRCACCALLSVLGQLAEQLVTWGRPCV